MSPESDVSTATVTRGLKGVMAADSAICLVNGTEGRLYYRGYNVDDLAEKCTYEEVALLLLRGELPTVAQLDEFRAELNRHCTLPGEVLDFLRQVPADTHPMATLRTAVSLAGIRDPQAEDGSVEANEQKAIRLMALIPAVTAAIHRLSNGEEPVVPDADQSIAAAFMQMLNGRKATADETRAMDLILILHAEHGFNASTFAARVIIATMTDIHSAVTGAIGALKGKLHGGANTEVLRTLEQFNSVADVAPWVEETRASKGKFMGFGHAVYQTADPRAKFLKELSQRLGEEKGEPLWYELSAEIEKHVTAAIHRECNVDFYSASLQHYMGIPKELFTCIFASSRISGWCAHIMEQLADNKIIRPSAHYVGEIDRPVVPLEDRQG